jgi:hypothetical protein
MRICFIAVTFLVVFSGQAQIVDQLKEKAGEVLGTSGLTQKEITEGLKEALVKGTNVSTERASQVDGYLKNREIRIPMPPEMKKVESKLTAIGMGKTMDKFVTSMNRGAEAAAKEAAPIFISAIKGMTVNDALGILKGQDKRGATTYLRKQTESSLWASFKPIMDRTLQQTSATKHYGTIVTGYNKLPMTDKLNPDLSEYATGRALDGLFLLIGQEEEKIRNNPAERTSDLLKKVFKTQD